MNRSKIILIGLIFLLCFTMVLHWEAHKEHENMTIRVGTEIMNPPFEFTDHEDNHVGFDIEITQAIAREMGYEWELETMYFTKLIPALQEGKIDIIASAMDKTDLRAEKVDMTNPYFYSTGYILMVRSDDSIKNWEDLAGKRVAVQAGTVPTRFIQDIKNMECVEFDTSSQCFFALANAEVDAVIMDRPIGLYYLNQHIYPNIKMVGTPKEQEPLVMAVKKGDREFKEKVNAALQRIKTSGEYDRIYNKWFGENNKKEQAPSS